MLQAYAGVKIHFIANMQFMRVCKCFHQGKSVVKGNYVPSSSCHMLKDAFAVGPWDEGAEAGKCRTWWKPVSFLFSSWWPAVVSSRASSEGVSTMDRMPGSRPSTLACHTRLNSRWSASRSQMLTLPLLHPAANPCTALQACVDAFTA